MLLVAAHAVSTSPAMPRYHEYVRAVRGQKQARFQPPPGELFAALRRLASRFPALAPANLSSLRLTAALISFVDDHDQSFPGEYLPGAHGERVWAELGRDADIIAILNTRVCLAQPTFLDAVLLAHLALRQMARGRDTRALGTLDLSLSERLHQGQRILPFAAEVSRGGDPLGDTYHYLATLAAGLAAGSARQRSWMIPLFAAGPELMKGVRERLFGSTLFFGNHARIDRLGLRHGLRLARGSIEADESRLRLPVMDRKSKDRA
jgi:hypothetical protein